MTSPEALFKLLGDDSRLRILRLLARERLNVSELVSILGQAQSGVSRQLTLLRQAGLVQESREGAWSFYRVDVDAFPPEAQAVWPGVESVLNCNGTYRDDDARLAEVLRHREEEVPLHGRNDRMVVPGRSWRAWARALGHLLPSLTVADVGCGEGYLAVEMAAWAKKVIAVDRSPAMLETGRAIARRRGRTNITWKEGDLEKLPLRKGSVDLVLLSQSLHHADKPAVALEEAARILAPGGRILVLDLEAHDEKWVCTELGDKWMGFDRPRLKRLLRHAGFGGIRIEVGAKRRGDPFVVLIASGKKQGAGSREQAG